jgi:hypothetical protein
MLPEEVKDKISELRKNLTFLEDIGSITPDWVLGYKSALLDIIYTLGLKNEIINNQ